MDGVILKTETVEFSVTLPDGSTMSATLPDQEVRNLVGAENEYGLDWWKRGAERKLGIWETLAALATAASTSEILSAAGSGFQVASRYKLRQPTNGFPRFELTYEHLQAAKPAAV